ncbi:MAG: hypothetical protein U9P71_00120 [Campylobacterota bacterium]|nr:hypothetical protein [Campylobacterota bacterium]
MQPKGFGKKYFTLAAIQAHSVHVTISRITTKIESQHLVFSQEDERDESLEEEEFLLLESSLEQLSNGSHCSCISTAQTHCKIKTYPLPRHSFNIIQAPKLPNAPPTNRLSSIYMYA